MFCSFEKIKLQLEPTLKKKTFDMGGTENQKLVCFTPEKKTLYYMELEQYLLVLRILHCSDQSLKRLLLTPPFKSWSTWPTYTSQLN